MSRKLTSQQFKASTGDEVAIKVEHVSKKYCKSIKRSMLYGMQDIGRNMIGLSSRSDRLRKKEFWAVDDVSFDVRKGETLGIIGPNGAGKTTILKMLNGIFWPDKGKITVRGRVGALIEVGAGFHPALTGRENIYINAAILGMSKQEVDEKFDEIVEFADIGDFLDTPVKFYSSGMFVKLGFAVAAHLEPDVLLVDEILAVGDVGFRAKCYRFIADILRNAAVIFISHSMPAVAKICDRVLVMNGGKCIFAEKTEQGIDRYYSLFAQEELMVLGTGEAQIYNIQLLDSNRQEIEEFRYGQTVIISFDVQISKRYSNFLISIGFTNQESQLVAQCHTACNSVKLINDGDLKHIEVKIPKLLLNPSHYMLGIIIYDQWGTRQLSWYYAAKPFNVKGDFIGSAPIQLDGEWDISQVGSLYLSELDNDR